jgi:hypothetical protein
MVSAAETPNQERVAQALQRLYLGDAQHLRREDLKKSHEVTAALAELAHFSSEKLIVEAAAGHAYLSLLGADLLGWKRLWLIERDPARAARCRDLAPRLPHANIEIRTGAISDPSLWPAKPDLVLGLHACGSASDDLIAAAIEHHAKHLWLVPCCYATDAEADVRAESMGISRQSEIRRRFILSFVDTRRTLTLESAGYEVTIAAFVAPTVTPHNLVFRARRVMEPKRMEEARIKMGTVFRS